MNKRNICITTFAIAKAGVVPLSNFIEILKPLSNNLYVISGNDGYEAFKNDDKIYLFGISHKDKKNVISRIIYYIFTQVKISYRLFKLRNKIDVYIFFIGGEGLVIPMLILKLLNKEVLLAFAGFTIKFSGDILSKVMYKLSTINLMLSSKIILYSSGLIQKWDLEGYEHKILIASEHFIDFEKFYIKKTYTERRNLIGYVGRFSSEKGVTNLAEAIPLALNKKKDCEFIFIGDGSLRDEIEEFIHERNLKNKVQVATWIQHEELPSYLNKLKLLVIPSYTEGLPNVMLEAMSCGTPVLATSVGSIPDFITDEETGFLMINNSPESIEQNIIRALEHPNLTNIAENARALIYQEFTYEAAFGRYNKIFNTL